MRHAALLWSLVVGAGALLSPAAARASCSLPPCVDAEPMWLAPGSTQFALLPDTTALEVGQIGAGATFGFRLRPAILTVPAPSRDGRDVNLLRLAVDATLGVRLGIGQRLELTAVAPVGLYQQGSGIKGITDQNAAALPAQSLHDPRLGFGYAFATGSSHFGAKLRFEAKLPLGNGDALAGEASAVASPSVALSARYSGFRAALELGARLRRPSEFYGSRVGSQGVLALGLGYELPAPHLIFTLEQYLLPSLVKGATATYLPAEWLATAALAPKAWRGVSLGLAGGSGWPVSSTPSGHALALGVPAFRGLLFARYAPGD